MRQFETFVALRYLRSKRKEVFISIITVISILGVAISVMVLDMVLAVMTGFELELKEKLIGANAHIEIRRFGAPLDQPEELIARVLDVPDVVAADSFTYNQAMITGDGGARGILIRGFSSPEVLERKLGKYLSEDFETDALFRPGVIEVIRPDGVKDSVKLSPLLVGRELTRKLGLAADQPVTIFSPRFTSSPQGLIPKQRRFVVVGDYRSGLVEYESGLAYTSVASAQSFFGLGEAVSGIEVEVRDMFEAKAVARVIAERLRDLEGLYSVTDWSEPNKPLWDAIELEKRVYFIVLLLLILVASFSVVSTLVMVVMEKGKDIAILKSLGASDASILKIFLLQGALIGAVGTLLGSILGIVGCWALREYGFEIDASVFSLDTVPVHIESMNFLLVAAAGFFITASAGIYPALRASRLRPAEALRYE